MRRIDDWDALRFDEDWNENDNARMERVEYAVEEYGPDGEDMILSFSDFAKWFKNWDQSDSDPDDRYDDVHDYLVDCVNAAIAVHPLAISD